ncbi:Ankyrin repeat domain-containing protein 50 [Mycena venus]|uniref:Ankyrin repeat domain-containing protein 50 n=1 Tax=Mycena venus TaxID=2733690 RepID=A0A8H6YK58_9AGAR|nr:Ankyrin repeat domain-containing protein 50 [Mycena venus]
MIIQQLFNNRALQNDSMAIAYFYFDFTNLAKQSVDNALRRLVLQLSRQSPAPYKTLKQQYDRCNGLTIPNYLELLVILQKHLAMFDCTYLILDALDEAEDHDHVSDFVETICAWPNTQLHILITSQIRPVFEKRFTLLKNLSQITIHKDTPSADIRLYISSELALRREFQGWKSKWAEITDSIMEKSAGMFRLATCLLQQIKKCAQPGDLKKALAALPDNLHDIYAESLRSIPEEYLDDIKRLFQWLVFSEWPLTLAELEDTIAFDFSNPDHYIFDPHERLIHGFFLQWLSLLISVTNFQNNVVLDTDGVYLGHVTVILAHSSVQDYLQKPHPSRCTSCPVQVIEEEAHRLMAQNCLYYMLYFVDHPLNKKTLQDYPLAMYAGKNWTFPLLHCHDQATLSTLAKHLLEHGSR